MIINNNRQILVSLKLIENDLYEGTKLVRLYILFNAQFIIIIINYY